MTQASRLLTDERGQTGCRVRDTNPEAWSRLRCEAADWITVGIAYLHDAPTGLSVSVWDGEVTAGHRRRHMALLASDPEWGIGHLLLTDLTGVCPSSMPPWERVSEAANAFLRRMSGRSMHSKWAVVGNHTFEHALQFGAHIEADVPRLIVFDTLSSVCRWLEVELDHVRDVVAVLRRQIRSSGTSHMTTDRDRTRLETGGER